MTEGKIFAGPRLRRIRQRLKLTQSQMAAELEISPSYVNLMERNQRPLTVQVLLKLAARFSVDLSELQGESEGETLRALKAVFADPLLSGEVPGPTELIEAADAAPNMARAVVTLHNAYREGVERLSDLSARLSRSDVALPAGEARLPVDEALDFVAQGGKWCAALEETATTISQGLRLTDDPFAAVRDRLREAHGVDTRVLPVRAMPQDRARFDRHSMRLFLSERLGIEDRTVFVALRLALIAGAEALDGAVAMHRDPRPETGRLIRIALARRLADAVLMPIEPFRAAARDLRHDLSGLSRRFVARPARVMRRMAAIGQLAEGDIPFFLVSVAETGAVIERIEGARFPFPRYGALCGRLPLFDDLSDGHMAEAMVSTGEGQPLRVLAVAHRRPPPDDGPGPRVATAIGARVSDLEETVYGAADGEVARPTGSTCRLCEVVGCTHRTSPPATRPIAFLDHAHGRSDFDFA